MRAPRNIHGRDFASHFIRRWAFVEIRQTGSHIILRTEVPSVFTVSVPAHKPLRVGTFGDLLEAIALHKNTTIETVLRKLRSFQKVRS